MPNLAKPNAVLWDLDGTLIDQTVAIVRCYETIISELGYPTPEPQAIRRSLGGPMASTMELFVEANQLDAACAAFRTRFPEMMYDGLEILDGALPCMEFLKHQNIAQAILTNKHGITARAVSHYCGFDRFAKVCLGNGDTEWNKPAPELTHTVLKAISAAADASILIGDSPTDVVTAQAAGIACFSVATGAHSEAELRNAGSTATFANLNTLLTELKA
ncbi:MAG: 5'-nucleotidase [Opitutia bacterium UBA7350]|nr:MAG: 5'-nucleotidase [Opitutae bacterium UBA7350]